MYRIYIYTGRKGGKDENYNEFKIKNIQYL